VVGQACRRLGARAAAEYPSDLRAHDQPIRLTLLAALAWTRQGEIVDGLVDLLIALVHKIDARAEQGAQAELVADLHRVRGKENLLFRLAEAALDHPDDTVRAALYPVVGPSTLAELVREGRASDSALRARTRVRLRSSYSSYYRRVIPELLDALAFRSSNTRHAPVIDALTLMRRYARRPNVRYYATEETVPLDGIVPGDWRAAVVEEREDGTVRVERIPYELCVLAALREAIRRREIWVIGAVRWRDPDIDLPADFDTHRATHYERLGQPLDPTEFIASLQGELSAALRDLDAAIEANDTGGVSIGARAGKPWITVPKLAKQAEPANLERLKAAVQSRWGTVDLLDFLAEADHHIGLVDRFPSIATRETTPPGTLRERLLLVLFALGTNTGIKHVADGDHGHSEAALRHVRRLHVTKENLRRAISTLVNANYAARDPELWGAGTACASDSKKSGSWESNLMTEWHARYRGPGVMIYWHVEKGRLCVYSQALRDELDVDVQRTPKTLPYVPSEDEIRRYYTAVWQARRTGDMVLIKTILYTGARVAELVAIRIDDVDLDACRIRITHGKGGKDRVVPYPQTFRETLALHIADRRKTGGPFLFESSWKKPYTPPAASARYSPATPPPPDYLTTCRPTGFGISCSPGSKPKASTTPSSSPTAATPAVNPWRSTADSPSPTPKPATTRPSADSQFEDHPSLGPATRSGVPGRLSPRPRQPPDTAIPSRCGGHPHSVGSRKLTVICSGLLMRW
jgi:hypothetical protein